MPGVPEGKVAAVEIISGRATSSVNALSEVLAGLLLSVTRMVKLKLPAVVGVPVIVAPVSASPGGKEPEKTDHV